MCNSCPLPSTIADEIKLQNLQELIARKRAEVAAKLANFSALAHKPLPSAGSRGPSLSLAPPAAALPSRPSPISTPAPSNGASKLPPGIDPDLAKKIAEAKRRADASRANIEINSNPYLVPLLL